MAEFMVMEIRNDDVIDGLGHRSFLVAPRVGEYITVNDEEGKCIGYKVMFVIHPLEGASTAGDILVKKVYHAEHANNFISELVKGQI